MPAKDVLGIAREVLAGRIAQAAGDRPAAIAAFEAAASIEDRLGYMEPPFWPFPVRQSLGAALLMDGSLDKAEAAFAQSLEDGAAERLGALRAPAGPQGARRCGRDGEARAGAGEGLGGRSSAAQSREVVRQRRADADGAGKSCSERDRSMSDPHPFARLLAVNPFFAGLEAEALELVAGVCVTVSLARDETLFMQGDAGDALYAVRRGQIRIAAGTAGGARITHNTLGPGDIFGEIAILDGGPRTADAIACEPSELFMLRRRDFLSLVQREPSITQRVITLLCERVRYANGRVEESVFLPLAARLRRRLVSLAEDFGVDLDVSQEELADLVGAARESVNRQLQAWRRRGMLEISRNRIRVLDFAALRCATAHEGTSR